MGKRKEIKFLCKDGQTREGRQDGVMFWIRKDQKREQDGLPAFYVAANDIKGKGRTIYTAGHEYFTLEGAKELCQQIMAGEANLAERKARYAAEAIKVMEAWGFTYKTAAFVWVKKNRKQGGNFMGLGAYTRANAEVCLLGVTPGFKAKTQIRAHNVHQIIEAPFEGHSKKPDETRQRIVELLGDVPRLEMFARQRADGWDAWGNEAPEA